MWNHGLACCRWHFQHPKTQMFLVLLHSVELLCLFTWVDNIIQSGCMSASCSIYLDLTPLMAHNRFLFSLARCFKALGCVKIQTVVWDTHFHLHSLLQCFTPTINLPSSDRPLFFPTCWDLWAKILFILKFSCLFLVHLILNELPGSCINICPITC